MNITLKSLQLTNFKGIRDLTIEFDPQITNILGENSSGKTTIFDAFTWVMFGKDGRDNKDFNIKTLDADGQAIPQIDHEVTAVIEVDGAETTLRRVYRERWQRRRGAEESEMTGHETQFYVNSVPLQAQEYKARIDGIVSESLFKLLTSTMYFNSLKWQDRRRALVLIAGEIGNADIVKAMKKDQIKDITAILDSGKDFEEYRKEIAMRKKKLNDDLRAIPSRVDEVKRSMPEPIDYDMVELAIKAKQDVIAQIESTINDQVTAYQLQGEAIKAKQDEIFNLKKKLQLLEYEVSREWKEADNARSLKIQDLKQKIHANNSLIDDANTRGESLLAKIELTKAQIATLRQKWSDISAEVFVVDEVVTICPACQRPFEDKSISNIKATLEHNFEESRSKRLAAATTEGRALSLSLQDMEEKGKSMRVEIDKMITTGEAYAAELEAVESATEAPNVIADPRYAEITKQIEQLELQVLESPKLDIEGLKQQKSEAQSELDRLRISMSSKEVISRAEARVKELLAEEKSLAQQISDLERAEFSMDGYTRVKMDMVEQRVNSKFKLVKFRMFEQLINGGITEACETTLGGIPFADVNSAGKIQAGVDIINTLSEHYQVWAPVFADNAESVNELPETKSQLIRLVVTKDPQLIVQ